MAATAIPGLDVTELGRDLQPYRNPRDALRKGGTKPAGIPGLDVTEIYDPKQPNFTTGGPNGPTAAPPARPAPQIGGITPGTAVAPSTRPNFTFQPNLNVMEPPPRVGYAAPQRVGYTPPPPPPLQPATVDPKVAEAARARTAGIPGARSFSGPPVPPGGVPPSAAPTGGGGAPPDVAAPPAAAAGAAPEPVTKMGAVKSALTRVAGATMKGLGALAAPAVAVDALKDGASPGNILGGAAAGGAVGGLPGAAIGATVAAGVGGAAKLGDAFAAKNPEYENSMPGVGYDIMSGLPYISEDNAKAVSSERVKSTPFTQPAQAAAAPPKPVVPEGPSDAQKAIDLANQVRFPANAGTNAGAQGLPASVPAPLQPDLAGINARTSDSLRGSIDVARGLDQYGPGGGGGGPAVSIGGDSIARRNLETTRSIQLDTLLNAAKSGNPRIQAAALQAYAQLAGQFAGNDNGLDVAQLRDGGDTTRANIASGTARRGQDIGSDNEAARNKTTLQGEQMRGKNALDVAGVQSEGRIEAALSRGQRPVVVPGGQEVRDINGLQQLVTAPARVFDPQAGSFVDPPGSTRAMAAPEAAIAKLRSNPALAAEFDAKYGKGAAAAALQSK